MNGLVVDQIVAQSIQTSSLSSSGMSIIGNCWVYGALIVGSLACTGALAASSLSSTNNLTVGGYASIIGDTSISGTLTVGGNVVGGSSLSTTDGSGRSISDTDIKLDHGNWVTQGWGDQVDQSGFQSNGNMWDAHSSYPSGHQTFLSTQPNAYIEFAIVSDTCLLEFTLWITG